MGVGRESARDAIRRSINELNEINEILSSDTDRQLQNQVVYRCVNLDDIITLCNQVLKIVNV